MKIKPISDIHVECDKDRGQNFANNLPNENVDVLIIAGDLSLYKTALQFFCDRFENVIYVLGNHCHWGRSFFQTYDDLNEISSKISNLYWLQNKRVKIGEHYFAGTTLWFEDFRSFESNNNKFGWIDYAKIPGSIRDIYNENTKSKEFLRNEVKEGDIVVTHHLPSWRCVSPKWRYSFTNKYFVNDIEDVIHNNKPALWQYGHTHDFDHFAIGDTEMICNPRAYPFEQHSCGFREDLTIDTSIEERYT